MGTFLLLIALNTQGLLNTAAASGESEAQLRSSECAALADPSLGDPSRVDPRCFTITSVRINETELAGTVDPELNRANLVQRTLNDRIIDQTASDDPKAKPKTPQIADLPLTFIERIQLIGGKIWGFIVANEAQTNITTDASADAIPEGIRSPMQLTGWKQPVIREFDVVYSNAFRVDVVTFKYRVMYTYGGRVNGKKGFYLTNIRVVPGQLRVLWGFKFDFEGGSMRAINVGTQKDPVAGVEVLARWRIYNPINVLGNTETFFVRGDGLFQRMTAGGALP